MRRSYFYLIGLWVLCACSPTRRLSPGQKLLQAPEVNFAKNSSVVNKKALGEELETLVRPTVNNPVKLWVFNLFKEPKKQKGFRHWMKYKIGEAPVLFNFSTINRNRLVLEKHLQDHGYLNAQVLTDTVDQGKKVKVKYEVRADKRYRIQEVHVPEGNTALDQLTQAHKEESFLKSGEIYQAENLRKERERLTSIAIQNGYYGISQNDVYFYVDTLEQIDSLDLYVRWKPNTSDVDLKKYRYGHTKVYPTYSLTDTSSRLADTIEFQDLKIIEDFYFVKENLLRRSIRGQTGDLYDGSMESGGLKYLQDLDIFKFINVRTDARQENGIDYLDRSFYLTPAQVRDVRFDFETNTRSGSYLGALTAVTYTNKNQFGGAERFDINFSVGAETQLGTNGRFLNTLEITTGASLSIPRLLLPLSSKYILRDHVSRTHFSLSNTYQIRTGFFTSNRLSAEMTYDWRSNRRMQHLWTPLSITRNNTLFGDNPDFIDELDENPRLRNLLRGVLILGGQYRFIYSSQEIGKKLPYLYFNGTIELAGNLTNLAANTIGGDTRPHRIFGTPFSQYLKLQADTRYYLQNADHSWAFRFIGGLVVPYGNSDFVPYSKQFFIGGSTSLRAFRLRQLGPGAYVNPSPQDVNFFDQTGEIKLEFTTEYRFDLYSYLKGAVFVDAGNIWLLNETINDSGEGAFKIDSFYKEIAVGSGLGLRVDFNYFVIRLDAAFPLRKPFLNEGLKWTLDRLDFLSQNWREENLVWHLAIGYPF